MARTTVVLHYLGNGPYGLDILLTYPRQFIRHIFNTGDTLDVTDIASPDELNRSPILTGLRDPNRAGGALFSVVVTPGSSDVQGAGFGAGPPIEGTLTPLAIGTASFGIASSVSASDHVHPIGTGTVGSTALASNAVTTVKITDANVTLAKLAAAVQQVLASVMVFGMGAAQAGLTVFAAPGSGVGSTTVELQVPVPRAGVLRNLRVKCQTAPGTGNTDAVTVRVNGVNSALTCNVVTTATTGSDLTHAPAVAAGDLVSVQVVQGATSIGANFQISFDFAVA